MPSDTPARASRRARLALYVHWPYCLSKCPYCDFNSHVAETIDHQAWAQAYITELNSIHQRIGHRQLTSIFFGGGTPSLMHPDTAQAVIDHAQKLWTFANDIEITLEANPTSVEREKLRAFQHAGINRVSIGIQALNDADLAFLGRQHSADDGIKAIETAQTLFDRSSFDLIYARPTQTISEWEQELSKALTLTAGHISLYQLTIEPGTPFYTQHQRGEFRIPEQDQAGEFYERTQEITADCFTHGCLCA